MSQFNFSILISLSMIFFACNKEMTEPIDEANKTNPLIGKWQEQLDTSTSDGKYDYKARTFLGTPWVPDTMIFLNDSARFVTSAPGKELRYKTRNDSIFYWQPIGTYDTSRTIFEVRHDTLHFDNSVIIRIPYYKKIP